VFITLSNPSGKALKYSSGVKLQVVGGEKAYATYYLIHSIPNGTNWRQCVSSLRCLIGSTYLPYNTAFWHAGVKVWPPSQKISYGTAIGRFATVNGVKQWTNDGSCHCGFFVKYSTSPNGIWVWDSNWLKVVASAFLVIT